LAGHEFAPLVINLRRNVIERLSRDVWHTFDSILSQGVEIGGLLLGTTARETGVIKIEDFAPLAWSGRPHRFVLSESECRALQSTLAASAWLRDSQFHVVGCYRSHVGEGFSLSANDLAFAQSCFQGPSSLFLQIKPSSGGTLSAALFSWGNGQNDSEYVFRVFPFDVRRLADAPDETCEFPVSDSIKTKQPFGVPVEQSFPVAFSETAAKPTEKVAVRIPACRHQRRVRRARMRAPRSVRRLLLRTRAFPWRARTLQALGYPLAVARAASRRVRTRVGQAGALVHRVFLAPVQTCLSQTRTIPWWERTLRVPWYLFAVLIILMELAGYRVYLSQGSSQGSTKDQMISGRPSNLSRSQFEVLATPVTRNVQTSAAASLVRSTRIAALPNRVAATGNRARRKPRTSSGKEPPFICAPRDVFYKTDAAPGWNTFTCLSKNVWSVSTALPVK
jgi:hypothetical protein